jgi:hypothetical protein
VGGYPLGANLDLKADSVRDALAAFGPDDALATFSFDAFSSLFVRWGQASLLESMMEALESKKRKADEMDSGNTVYFPESNCALNLVRHPNSRIACFHISGCSNTVLM